MPKETRSGTRALTKSGKGEMIVGGMAGLVKVLDQLPSKSSAALDVRAGRVTSREKIGSKSTFRK